MKLQKIGGFAAIASIFAYFAFIAYSRIHLSGNSSGPATIMSVMMAAPGVVYMYNLLSMAPYILLLVMFVALHERMHADAPYLSRMMLIAISAGAIIKIAVGIASIGGFGMILPAQDISAFRALSAILTGLSLTGGHACGWACLLLGCAILRTQSFSRIFGWLFLVYGIGWVMVSMLPTRSSSIALAGKIPTAIFCAGCIWIGILMLRQKQFLAAAK